MMTNWYNSADHQKQIIMKNSSFSQSIIRILIIYLILKLVWRTIEKNSIFNLFDAKDFNSLQFFNKNVLKESIFNH